MKLFERQGNLLDSNCDIICHQVNCCGVMGSGIAKQIRQRWPNVYHEYQSFNSMRGAVESFGKCFLARRDANKYVANLFGQLNYGTYRIQTDYPKLQEALESLKIQAKMYCPSQKEAKIGFPYKMSCGLAGGDWNTVYKMICETFADTDYNIEIWKFD